jgi:hypothetical protein
MTTVNNLVSMEIINGLIMQKIAGNITNVNVLKSTILNLNIIMKTDALGCIYFGITTSSVFTPIAGETLALVCKGKY